MAQQDRTEFERRDPMDEDVVGQSDEDDFEDEDEDEDEDTDEDEESEATSKPA